MFTVKEKQEANNFKFYYASMLELSKYLNSWYFNIVDEASISLIDQKLLSGISKEIMLF